MNVIYYERGGDRTMNNEKTEEMLSQLIKMVGTVHSDQQEMKQDIVELKDKVVEIETKSDIRHKEIIGRFKSLERDQDFIWEKAVRNEREIASLKTK